MSGRVLVLDDDRDMCEMLAAALARRGWTIEWRTSAPEAWALFESDDFDVVVSDINLGGMTGLELCERLVANRPDVPVVVITAFGSLESAIAAIRAGAYDFLTKPFAIDVLILTLERALRHRALREEVKRLRQVVEKARPFGGLWGQSPEMQSVARLLDRIASSGANVLITGETGTGKEVVARAVHEHGRRPDGPFVAVNCAALPEPLLESELLGHVRGAFTGATMTKRGKFALADGGSIFLDEIGTMTTAIQAKLLRVLQEREFEPLGAERTQRVDVRVIAATNRDLKQMVSEGKFQEDLYYRLNVIPIVIPPLRERRDDIGVLIDHFVEKHRQRTGKRIERLEDDVVQALLKYDWPGNVRELENTIERAVVLATGPVISSSAISLLGATSAPPAGLPSMRLHQNLEWVERETIRRALEQSGGVKKDAAEAMGISQRALSYYLAKYRID